MLTSLIRNSRIRSLVISLAILAATPLLSLALPPLDINWLPVSWAISSVTVGLLLVLSFWVGMGLNGIFGRIVGGVFGAAYVAFWPVVHDAIMISQQPGNSDWSWQHQTGNILMSIALVGVSGGVFLGIGKWWKLGLKPNYKVSPTTKAQFSLLAILLLMSFVAVLFAGMKATRDDMATSSFLPSLFIISILCFNTVGAVFAALSVVEARLKCVLVVLSSVLLGFAISFALGQDRNGWWLFVGGSELGCVPTLVVLGTLLVVRSAGYRLIRNSESDAHRSTTPTVES